MKSILKTSFSHLGFLQIFESVDLWGNFHFFGWFICITVWWICGVFGSNWKQLIMSYYTPSCCSSPPKSSSASAELKVYQAFIFSVPIFFTFILLLLFYLFYLRRRRVDWSSLRMRTSLHTNNVDEISRAELGLKKELREMLPIVIYKESFSIRDAQCSVCLADYQAEDKLQQIPACGHAFHMDCIDHWLTTHTTCPLCRLSLLAPAKASSELSDIQQETIQESSVTENADGASDQQRSEAYEEPQAVEHSESRNEDGSTLQNSPKEQGRSSHSLDNEREVRDTTNETGEHEQSRRIPDLTLKSPWLCIPFFAPAMEQHEASVLTKFRKISMSNICLTGKCEINISSPCSCFFCLYHPHAQLLEKWVNGKELWMKISVQN